MKYYIGYFNKPWDEKEFTIICIARGIHAAQFIFSKYREYDNKGDTYYLLSANEIIDKKLKF